MVHCPDPSPPPVSVAPYPTRPLTSIARSRPSPVDYQRHPTAEENTKRKRLVIDSRSRDLFAYPSPAKYEVNLHEDLFNVTSVNLIVADVPFSAYLVGPGRRSVPFSFSPSENATLLAVATLPVGDYVSPGDLAHELGVAMTAAAAAAAAEGNPKSDGLVISAPATFTVSYSARTDAYTVAGTVPFALRFAGRAADTPARVFGFGFSDYASTQVHCESTGADLNAVVAPFRRDFRKDRYVVLKLTPNAEVITSVTNAIDRTFAVVPFDCALNVMTDNIGYEKRWTPPLSRVGRLTIQFVDSDGNLYDFQNQDHRLELMFEVVAPPFPGF